MYVNASKNEISVNKLLLPTEINGVPFDVKLIVLICDGQNFNMFLPRNFDVSIGMSKIPTGAGTFGNFSYSGRVWG